MDFWGFWITAGVLAALSTAILAVATLRRRDQAEPAAAYDLRVYRDQLKEVDKDLARGVLAEAEAERARTEIARRILAADAQMQTPETGPQSWTGRTALILSFAVAVIGGSVWLYARIGQPGYGDQPQAERIAFATELRESRPSQADAEAEMPPSPAPELSDEYTGLVQQLRQTVAERPDDLQGQMLLARNEALLGNYKAAYEAQEQVLRLRAAAATGTEHLYMADMMILAAGGYVSPEAETVLKRALTLDPRNGAAQYYWGLIHAQTGRPDLAFRVWQRLLRVSAPEAPWIPPIRAQIEDIAAQAGEARFTLPPAVPARPSAPAPAIAGPGPSAEDVEAAQDMTPEERQQMVAGMVEGLAERLATEGGSAEEWARLIQALSVMGDTDRARAILGEARQVFASDDRSMAVVDAAAKSAGLTP